jgi:glucose/arabinose dehydrogenase
MNDACVRMPRYYFHAMATRHSSAGIGFLTAATLGFAVSAANAADRVFHTDKVAVKATVLADGLNHPWGLAFLPEGGALVTERSGDMRIFKDGALSDPVVGVPDVRARGQGGLLDVALSPAFASDRTIFLSYSEPALFGLEAGTAVARARLVQESGKAHLEDLKVIFSMAKRTFSKYQYGSRLVFAPDGTLFVTVGDRGDADRAQDMQDSAGSVLHINPDGSIPSDNPSPDGSRMLPQIWSKGHRNGEGAVFDPVWNALVTVEHGAKGGDELNRPEAGKNYGWPVISYGVEYSGEKIGIGTSADGYEQPIYYWDPSIAPSGLASYQADMFPEWKGDLLVGALKFQLVARLDRDEAGKIVGEERMFQGEFGRIRDVEVAPDGSVWLLTDEDNGQIIRLSRGE